jgi:sugar lactone lactonase YvrE
LIITFILDSLCATTTWTREGKTIVGGTQGNGTNQLSSPAGIHIDSSNALYIADRLNHRIVKWEQGANTGTIVAGGSGPGVEPGKLYQPTSVTVDKEGTMYITDNELLGGRVTRWRKGSKVGEVLLKFASTVIDGITLDPKMKTIYILRTDSTIVC